MRTEQSHFYWREHGPHPTSVTLKKITGGQSWKKLSSFCQPLDLMKKEMEAQKGQGILLRASN